MSEAVLPLHPEQLQQFVLGLVQPLCDQPEAVDVVVDGSTGDLALRVTVADADMERLLGKGGRTARSLRTIVGAAAAKAASRCTLDIRSDA